MLTATAKVSAAQPAVLVLLLLASCFTSGAHSARILAQDMSVVQTNSFQGGTKTPMPHWLEATPGVNATKPDTVRPFETRVDPTCATCAQLNKELRQSSGRTWYVRCHLMITGHDMGLPMNSAAAVDQPLPSNIAACAKLCADHSCSTGEPNCCQAFTFVVSEIAPDLSCFLKTGLDWSALNAATVSASPSKNAEGVRCVSYITAWLEDFTGCDADPSCRATKQSAYNAFSISIVSLCVAALAAFSSAAMCDMFKGCCVGRCGGACDDRLHRLPCWQKKRVWKVSDGNGTVSFDSEADIAIIGSKVSPASVAQELFKAYNGLLCQEVAALMHKPVGVLDMKRGLNVPGSQKDADLATAATNGDASGAPRDQAP